MQPSTLEIVKAGLRADPTVSPSERVRLLAMLRAGPDAWPATPHAVPCLLRHDEAARRLGGVTKKTVNNLARSGLLTPVRLPGRVRALGFRESDVMALIEQRKV